MMGLLGFLSEATEISAELGVPFEQALRIQRERANVRLRDAQAPADAPLETHENSNVICVDFRPGSA